MSKLEHICMRCGLSVTQFRNSWKHCANGHTKSCGKAPHVVTRQAYEASMTAAVARATAQAPNL